MSEPSPVANLDDERLIREGEHAADAYAKSGRDNILPMARGLVAARRKYSSDQDFGRWFDQSPYSMVVTNHTMRAALIFIGNNDQFAAPIIQNCRTTDPEAIAEALKGILRSIPGQRLVSSRVTGPSDPPVSGNLKPTPRANLISESPPAIAEMPKNETPPESKPNAPSRKKYAAVYSAPMGPQIAELFTDKDGRSMLSKVWKGPNGKQIWELVTTAYEAGLITPNGRTMPSPSLHLLFPAGPATFARRFDLTNPRQRKQVKEEILPVMIACKDRLLAKPDDVIAIMATYKTTQTEQQATAVKTERREIAIKALPMAEQELMMFGQTVWPRLDNRQGEYDYDQIRTAIWTFRGYESWNVLGKESTQSLAIRIRNVTRYLGEYMDRCDRSNRVNKILSLISWLSFLMETNPTAECKWPMYPHVEGQW